MSMPRASVFPTEIGWCGFAGRTASVATVVIGHLDAAGAWTELTLRSGTDLIETDWLPELRRKIVSYAQGYFADFTDCPLDLSRRTAFQSQVVAECRRIPYGRTLSYGELAARAGSPGAARAVGRVMATNPLPLLVPCHRVVGASGRLGGFSAPCGVEFKKRLLAMEATAASVLEESESRAVATPR